MAESPHTSRRRLQFRLRQLFVAITGVSLGCGLVAWLGPASLGLLFLACGPIVTWAALNRTEGDCPHHAVALGAAIQALLIASVLVTISALPVVYSNASPEDLMEVLALPIVAGFAGGISSIALSLPFLWLWYAVRSVRQSGSGNDDSPTSRPPDSAP